MSIKLGGSKSKTSSTNTSTSTSTTTPNAPEWASSLTQNAAGRIQSLMGLDPGSLVAPVHGLQQQAAEGASALTGLGGNFDAAAGLLGNLAQRGASTYQPMLGSAAGYTALGGQARGYQAGQAQAGGYDAASYGGATLGPAASVLDNLSAYYNPYRDQITDPVLADLDASAGRTRAQQDLDLAGSGAFGGSGAALTRSATEGELARARATTLSGLLDGMFKTSTGLAAGDADRRQQAAIAQAGFLQEAGLANAAAANRAREFGAAAGNEVSRFNVDAANQALAAGALADNEMTRANLEAANRAREYTAGAWNAQGLANQSASNDAARFNAQADETAMSRQMDAAKNLVDFSTAYEANQRANIGAQAQLGGTLRDIDQQQRQAPITNAQQIVAMLNGLPISLFTGQTTNTNQTGSGTSTTKGTEWSAGATLASPFHGIAGLPLG